MCRYGNRSVPIYAVFLIQIQKCIYLYRLHSDIKDSGYLQRFMQNVTLMDKKMRVISRNLSFLYGKATEGARSVRASCRAGRASPGRGGPRVGGAGVAGTRMRAETASEEARRRLLTRGKERFMKGEMEREIEKRRKSGQL